MNIVANWRLRRLTFSQLAVVLVLALALILAATAFAATQLSIAGYLDFGYPDTVLEPTEGRPEHKLWYNDGKWWANMYSTQSNAYTIHHLDWDSQNWVSTGVVVDERPGARSDTLWDGTKLYIASYLKQENPGPVNSPENFGRLYRYSYTGGQYVLDAGFPLEGITEHRTKTLSLEKDSTGRLWIAYVTRPTGTSLEYQVYVRSSGTDDLDWMSAPIALAAPDKFPNEAMVASHDIAALIAFEDEGGQKLGVMWSNERPDVNKFFFAVHPVSSVPNQDWVMELDESSFTGDYSTANDHINLAKTSSGDVFAAIKTSDTLAGQALNAVIARDRDGSYSFHTINPVESNDTKPIVVVYEPASGPDKVYVFMSSNPTGGVICVVEAEITPTLSAMSFPVQNCGSSGLSAPPIVLGDNIRYTLINNITTTRQILNESTDIVLLATDQINNVYVHAVVIDPPDVVDDTPLQLFMPYVTQ
jgi:hypothetical protein